MEEEEMATVSWLDVTLNSRSGQRKDMVLLLFQHETIMVFQMPNIGDLSSKCHLSLYPYIILYNIIAFFQYDKPFFSPKFKT